jgi:spermidine synthase
MARWMSGVLAFLTAGSVLVMEIVASRLLAPYLGVTLQTYTAIIGTVLAGISLGAYSGGRLADRREPRLLLGPILMIGGALVLASLGILRAVGDRVGGGSVGAVALAGAAFLLPAGVLSMVSPTLIKMSMGSLERAGREVGRIEALGTAGAIVGTFVAGFVLVARLRSDAILIGEGVFLITLGVVVWLTVGRGGGRSQQVVAAVALVAVTGGGGLALRHDSRCAYESRYFCVNIETDPNNPSGRYLNLDTLQHSYVDLNDPTRLEFSYVRGIAAGIAAKYPGQSPLAALHVGGGGFTLPRFLNATRPGSTNLVIERDPVLVRLDEQFLGLKLGTGVKAITGDGRILVRAQPLASFDVVIGDAFGGEWVPWHLTTVEFIRNIHDRLKPGGMYALNMIDNPPSTFVRAEIATIAKVFRHIALATSSPAFANASGDNFVVYASDDPLPVEAIRREVSATDGWEVRSDEELLRWVGNVEVLTDAFAPVEQLLTPS